MFFSQLASNDYNQWNARMDLQKGQQVFISKAWFQVQLDKHLRILTLFQVVVVVATYSFKF